DGETYRAAYTVHFDDVVYVLDVFQKKSKSGAKTPKPDKERVIARFKAAKKNHEQSHTENEKTR
ncbi:type II toxin-antitoxin system RelE/ParE family toxin, partial [Gemmatimonas sp.]|uniref:type II toxin-antitoxin system RelE/ParE family toxin n=1 Tax=Gemmatimonas sp. TaxID=1962908 RepID=UPI0037C099AB